RVSPRSSKRLLIHSTTSSFLASGCRRGLKNCAMASLNTSKCGVDLVKIFWTPQLSNFSHLSHFRLILIRAFVPQVRMQTAAVVKHSDVIQYILLGFMAGLVAPPLNPLLLQAAEEAFYNSIVPAVTLPAHAAFKAVSFQ